MSKTSENVWFGVTNFVEKSSSLTWVIWAQKKEELTKRRSKVQEKIMSCEFALNFDQ